MPEMQGDGASVVIEENALDDLLDGIDVEAKPPSRRVARVH
jgi:hypothetical protein